MAAPSGTIWGNTVGGYGRIGIYVSLSSTNTATTPKVQIWFWSKYSVSDSSNTLYYTYDDASSSAKDSKGSKNIKTTSDSGGWSTTNQVKLYEYTHDAVTRGTSAKKRYLYAKLTNVDRVGGTMYVNTTISIPKLATYTISYNANGGSGAPSSQTKYYGKTLTLSSTTPTRTGYTFQGWGTSSTDTSVNYKAGGSYTANAGDTLYAIWKINTWTVKYDANGGSGAPGNNTKTYGKTLTLSKTVPTRTGYDFKEWNTKKDGSGTSYASGANYTSNSGATLYAIWTIKTYTIKYNANGGTGAPSNQTKTYNVDLMLSKTIPKKDGYVFKGWSTSSAATSVTYKSGVEYKANASVTLYAVWESGYKKPRIASISVDRCTSEKVLDDDGDYALINFNWTTDKPVTKIKIYWKQSAVGSYSETDSYSCTIPGSANAGSIINQRIGSGNFSTDYSYDIKIVVGDSIDETVKYTILASSIITIDMLGGGKGVSFGKAAEFEDTADFNFRTLHRRSTTYHNNKAIFGTKPDGTACEVMNPINANGDTVIGYGHYSQRNGNTNVYGHNIAFGISDVKDGESGTWYPYRHRGHSSTDVTIRIGGYVTGSGKEVNFVLPLSVPIIGSPKLTVTSNRGFLLRQNGKYTHGTSYNATNGYTYTFPDSYEVSYYSLYGIRITAKFSNAANATNNDVIGIYWSGNIRFD